jgi:hypothetical protein
MDRIMQYQRIIDIKPEYYALHAPYFMPSWYRFESNVSEIQLWFDEEFEVFRKVPQNTSEKNKSKTSKKGCSKKFKKKLQKNHSEKKKGGDNNDMSRIIVLLYDSENADKSLGNSSESIL